MLSNLMLSFRGHCVALVVFFAAIGGDSMASANNVTARVSRGVLVVRGDGAANHIIVRQNGNGGLVIAGQRGTLVNQRSSFSVARPPAHVEISLGSGNDSVRLENMNVRGDLDVYLGSGNNSVVGDTGNSFVGGDFDIYGGNQRDTVNLKNWTVAGSVDVELFGGVSSVQLDSVSAGASIDVYGGAQADTILLTSVAALEGISVETFGGADIATIVGGSANSMEIYAGDGNNQIDVSDVEVGEDVDIITGRDVDTVVVENVTAERDIEILLGAGNDFLTAIDVTAFVELFIDGGAGSDTRIDGGLEGFGERVIRGFEARR